MSANKYLTKRDELVTDICQILNVQDAELPEKINTILSDNKKLKKENLNLLKKFNYLKILETISNENIVSGCNIQVLAQEHFDGKILKNILEDIKNSQENLILTILQKNKSKLEIYSLVTKDCFKLITAKEIINMLNNKYGSTGGGREDLAQAGLEYENNLDDLAINIKKYISEIVSSKEN